MTDDLARHLEARTLANWDVPRGLKLLTANSAHDDFVNMVDEQRSPQRAGALREALDVLRRSAISPNVSLDWELLHRVQVAILGRDTDFRTGSAFAKGGAECYGFSSNVRAQFEQCLEEAQDSALHPLARATRAYLDVSFFHPFPDGNARSARMVFEYITSRANIGFRDVRPVFVTPRIAGDVSGYERLLERVIIVATDRAAVEECAQ